MSWKDQVDQTLARRSAQEAERRRQADNQQREKENQQKEKREKAYEARFRQWQQDFKCYICNHLPKEVGRRVVGSEEIFYGPGGDDVIGDRYIYEPDWKTARDMNRCQGCRKWFCDEHFHLGKCERCTRRSGLL